METYRSETNVIIKWSPNTNDNGAQITQYKIEIKLKDESWVVDPLCNGAQVTTFLNAFCSIAMQDFIAEPYLLERDDLIVARVQALNAVGWSETSPENIEGQTVETAPTQVPQPIKIDLD